MARRRMAQGSVRACAGQPSAHPGTFGFHAATPEAIDAYARAHANADVPLGGPSGGSPGAATAALHEGLSRITSAGYTPAVNSDGIKSYITPDSAFHLGSP